MKPDEPRHDLPLDLAREILHEVCQTTRESGQHELYEFSCLLDQLSRLGGETNDTDPILNLIREGLDEIQCLVADDRPSSDRLQSLQGEVIGRWGGQLSIGDHDEATSGDHGHDVWQVGLHEDDHEDAADEDELVSPSAEEISLLLGQLGSNPYPQDSSCEPAGKSSDTQVRGQVESPIASSASAESANDVTTAAEGVSHRKQSDDASASIALLDPELREAFLDDASSCVSSMEECLLKLDSEPKDSEALNQICRELHTLKGASASVGLADLASHLHELEDRLRDDHVAGRAPEIDSLLKSVDAIRSQICGQDGSSEAQSNDSSSNTAELPHEARPAAISSLADFSDGSNDDEMVRVKSSQLNRLMDMLAELVMLRNRRETELSDLQEVYHELIGSVSKMRLLSNEGIAVSNTCTSLQLSEVANDVLEVAQHVRHCARPVAEGNTAVSQFIRQFRQELVALRRTPVSVLFRRLQRVVRDAANAEQKEVRLQLIGEDAGIERSLQQRLYEPLLHIVRNSVCHGIERPEDRERNGKTSTGTITLEAKSGPDLFVIEIRDDGRGLDYDAIRRRGVESGLLSSDQVASREELGQLIFHPGFSTRQTANQIAGRGVGMDVVASTIQRMRGWLEIDSQPDEGTRIRLSIPLPSVIQHAMVFRSAGQLFALPMQSVRSAGESDRTGKVLALSQMLGCQPAETSQFIVLACESPSGLASGGSARVTLMVDEVIGPEEVVIRPLPTLLKQHPYCSGATLSGMGQTVLFLDARRLVESQASWLENGQQCRLSSNAIDVSRSRPQRPRVLVVDDSLSARKRVVRSLRRYPVEIVEACDGKQALEILKKQRFVAIFSDMEMPHVSGMELLAEVNGSDRKDPTPVVIISSRTEDEFTQSARKLGANNYLFKPLADDALDHALLGIPSLQHLEIEQTKPLQASGEIND